MSDYNSGFTGDRVVELLNMIPNLAKADLSIVEPDTASYATCLSKMKATRLI